MEKPLLNDPQIIPSEIVLKAALKDTYQAFEAFYEIVKNAPGHLVPTWQYYRGTGGSWLCKIESGKRTIIWLSVWDGYFKTVFYFSHKYKETIAAQGGTHLIDSYVKSKPDAKFLALVVEVRDATAFKDIETLIMLKTTLK